jgi:6-pyruvoyltetrahydropterin/6-carboxytetrahydropterin synthase
MSLLEQKNGPHTARLARRVRFSCGHRYHNPNWTEEKNKQVFGSCYSEHGHGHNYILEGFFLGPIDPESGMVMNLAEVDQIMKITVLPLDHHHLNFDVAEFKSQVPTTENIAKYCFEKLDGLVPEGVELYKVRLYEAEDLWVDYGSSLSMDL